MKEESLGYQQSTEWAGLLEYFIIVTYMDLLKITLDSGSYF